MRDRFSGTAGRARASMQGLSKEALALQRQQLTMQRNINAAGAMMGGIAIRGMYQWAKVGAEFGYTMNYVKTLAGEEGFDKLNTKAKTLGAQTMFTARQVADGMKFMAMAGQNTQDIYNNIAASVALAGATMSRLEGKGGAADIITNVMKGFNIEASERNSMRVADILTTATTQANTNLWDLHEGMKYAVSTASSLGGTLEELSASLMMLGNAGIQGSMAGVAVENMYRYIARAANEAKSGRQGDALAALGLHPSQLIDAEGKLLGLSSLLHLISSRFNQMAESDRRKGMNTVFGYNVMADLFNVRGNRAGLKLSQNLGDLDKFINMLNTGSEGRAMNNMNSMMDTLQGAGLQMSSAWETFKINFTEAIQPVVIPLMKALTGLIKTISTFMSQPVGKVLTVMGAGFVVVKTVSMAYRAIVASLRLFHMQMAASHSAASSTMVGNYARMSAAARGYAASSGMAGFMGFGGGRYGKGMAKRGFGSWSGMTAAGAQYVIGKGGRSRFVPKGSAPMGWSMGSAGKWAKYGKYAGRGSVPAMIAGMGLSALSDYSRNPETGEKTGWGKGFDVAGQTLSWAGTGAMLGSIIPGVGTAVGAIVGGVGGLLYGLYDNLKDAEDTINDASKQDTSAKDSKLLSDKVATLAAMKTGDTLYAHGFSRDNMWASNRYRASQFLNENRGTWRDGQKTPNRIIINIDGVGKFDKVVEDGDYREMIDLGGI